MLSCSLDWKNSLPVVQEFVSALGESSLLLFLPWLNAALHLPSPLLSFPLTLRRLLKLGLREAKTGITFHFNSVPCSDALISCARVSPNNSQNAFPKHAPANRGMAPSFRGFLPAVHHSAQSKDLFSSCCIIKLERDQACAARCWEGRFRGWSLQSAEEMALSMARGTSGTPKVR